MAEIQVRTTGRGLELLVGNRSSPADQLSAECLLVELEELESAFVALDEQFPCLAEIRRKLRQLSGTAPPVMPA